MAVIRSEISKYKEIVLALDREMHNRGQKEITWDSFTHEDDRYSPHSVIVCNTSDTLKQMGFMQSFTYDKVHLQNAMYPEDGVAPHAHGLTVDELLKLPQLLNNPVAIVTEHEGRAQTIEGDEYRCLHFLCATKEDGEQKYYRAIVHPQAQHNGLLVSGFASKVITYHKIDERKFEAILNGALDGKRQMLYFDSARYAKIDSYTKPMELCNYESQSKSISGHFTQDQGLKDRALEHQVAVRCAATAEMKKLIVGNYTRGESFPILTSSLNALAHGRSLDVIRSAYNTVQKISTLTRDRVLSMRTQEYADKSFAKSYIALMPQDVQQDYISRAVNRINSMSVRSQSDLLHVCDEIDRLTSKAPTLKNLGINFSDNVSRAPVIMEARQISGQLQDKLEKELANVLREKSTELKRSQQHAGVELVDQFRDVGDVFCEQDEIFHGFND